MKANIKNIQDYANKIESELSLDQNQSLPNINDAMTVLWSAIEDDLKLVKDKNNG
jgi:hypothetical protein